MKTLATYIAEWLERAHERRVKAVVEMETRSADWLEAEAVCRAQREKQVNRHAGV